MTLGLLLPLAARMRARYIANNYRFGDRPFQTAPPLFNYYLAYMAVMVMFAIGVGLGLYAAMQLTTFPASFDQLDIIITDPELLQNFFSSGFFIVLAGFSLFYLALNHILNAWLTNLLFNHLEMQAGNRFHSSLKGTTMAWIGTTNLAAIILTLGLALPWAKIRMARYRADCLNFAARDNLDMIAAGTAGQTNVVGEELADLWGAEAAI